LLLPVYTEIATAMLLPQTISDMVIYNRSRRDARRRFKMRNMKERQMMKFKVGVIYNILSASIHQSHIN
jgi:hypothetical protein